MKGLTYIQRVSVMRILLDIIFADSKVDHREQLLFDQIANSLGLDETVKSDVENLNSLIALAQIHDFTLEQKREFAKLMGMMIIVDKDINYNEVVIYNVDNDFCGIKMDFMLEGYSEYTMS